MTRMTRPIRMVIFASAAFEAVLSICLRAEFGTAVEGTPPVPQVTAQLPESTDSKSAGCLTCHTSVDEPSMHPGGNVTIGCADCHGGDPSVSITAGTTADSK